VHRDVKPSNILVDEDDFAYLIDFGIARAADQTSLTSTGIMIGSWKYMAPERFRAQEADARADIYALACVLYECLTGSCPFPGGSMESQFAAHLTEPPPRPSSTDPKVPAALDAVVATGMAKDPDQRYATTVELAEAARDAITAPIRQPVPPPTRPREASADTLADREAPQSAHTVLDYPDTPPPQQIPGPTQPATRQRPPWPPAPQPRPADRPPPQIGTPPPSSGQGHGQRVRWPLIGLVIGLVVILAAAAIGYFLWLRPSPSQTISAQSAPPSASAPTTGPPANSIERLLSLVPSGDHCVAGAGESAGGLGSVEVRCTPGVPQLKMLEYYLFSDRGALESAWADQFSGAEACPGLGPSPQNWHRGSDYGRVWCVPHYNTGPDVLWTVDNQLLLGEADGHDGAGMDQPFQWWAARYQ
jgi:serine/threonine protein kinase